MNRKTVLIITMKKYSRKKIEVINFKVTELIEFVYNETRIGDVGEVK